MTLLFFFNDTATTEIYTLSLHDALPIWRPSAAPGDDTAERAEQRAARARLLAGALLTLGAEGRQDDVRSEEHTSELQSRQYLVCRLLLEKKKTRHGRYELPIWWLLSLI